ncbi:MAG: primosomal protein N' [Gammaproteobacteria bacterium]
MTGAPAESLDDALRVTVAVFAPLRQHYDYRWTATAADATAPAVGARVWVPLGRAHRVGIVTALAPLGATEAGALKAIDEVLDTVPLLGPEMIALARWSAAYYHHPPGDVLASLLPPRLRRRAALPVQSETRWRLTAAGHAARDGARPAARRQRAVLDILAAGEADAACFAGLDFAWRGVLARLVERGAVARRECAGVPASAPIAPGVTLNDEQQAAVSAISAALARFQPFVLHGVTGSGKTEVYLECIARCLAHDRRALVLVPEIALTQQLVERFRARFGNRVALLHSGLGERERLLTWDACRRGSAQVLIGTRSAVWVGLPALGLVVVDEEHDASYKQQEGFRYSARDVAIVRAQQAGIPVVLGSATPALETLANLERGRYCRLRLAQRALNQAVPAIGCIDVRGHQLPGGLGETLLGAMREHLARGEQVVLFLNRRGYAPLLICRSCGEPRRCDHCDAYLVYHKAANAARCHHCDRLWPMRRPAGCCELPDIAPIGLGTERLEEVVAAEFPAQRVLRMDRDTVRNPQVLREMLDAIAAGRVDILIGTQMVAKGFDFANVTLVGIVDADSRLHALDFRAEERLAQLLVQVAGRAGRAHKPGRVLIQTHQPHHPVLRRVIAEGYEAYAAVALEERRAAELPPFAAMAIVRAESPQATRPFEFLGELRQRLRAAAPGVEVSYPIPALMERRAGRYRALVVLRAPARQAIGRLLGHCMDDIDSLARAARVRYAIDVDPQDTL